MMESTPSIYARRLRLSIFAVAAAVALTLAAFVASQFSTREQDGENVRADAKVQGVTTRPTSTR